MMPAYYATGLSKHQLFVLGYWRSFRIITPLNFLLWPMLGICLPRKHRLPCPIRYFLPIVNKKWFVFFDTLENKIVRVKATTRVEATGFVLAAMMQKPELRERSIVINAPSAYPEVNHCVKSKMLILNYYCEHDVSTENGNHVILCYGKEDTSIRGSVSLVELPKFHYIRAFKDMGVPDPEELLYLYARQSQSVDSENSGDVNRKQAGLGKTRR